MGILTIISKKAEVLEFRHKRGRAVGGGTSGFGEESHVERGEKKPRKHRRLGTSRFGNQHNPLSEEDTIAGEGGRGKGMGTVNRNELRITKVHRSEN